MPTCSFSSNSTLIKKHLNFLCSADKLSGHGYKSWPELGKIFPKWDKQKMGLLNKFASQNVLKTSLKKFNFSHLEPICPDLGWAYSDIRIYVSQHDL